MAGGSYAPTMIELLMEGQFQTFFLIALVLVIAISLHEFSHAISADLQGDPTPRTAGRVTLNPLKHLDPIGTFAIVLVGFGWGKPVPFTPRALRNQRFGPAGVALAGPLMNLLLAILAAFLLVVLDVRGGVLGEFLGIALFLNVLLAVFNLIPLPPLDGSRILSLFLPPHRQNIIYFLDRWGFLILLLLMVLRVISRVIFPLVTAVQDFLVRTMTVLIG